MLAPTLVVAVDSGQGSASEKHFGRCCRLTRPSEYKLVFDGQYKSSGGVLAVRARGDGHVGAAFGEIGHRRERVVHQAEQDAVHLAQHEKIARLRDVLRRRSPVHPAAVRFADDA